ncbi:LPS export ABC transporter periplasmic protein LptC [Candidatus Pelagibacter communis]|uniref:LPS export ABC transporter periplasmic protein LptC n=1 Tax=Candidatus Pelagibacter TaxID=198251 RepID=UPI00094D4411|nr:LPS export ABC transporter periplasmic protein LptC [Candidatus Pelagibacter ubique]|tara:strand:+ start:1584 stop:2159 length:576 start_codon:yes stop_codon:yes gene_type:complete
MNNKYLRISFLILIVFIFIVFFYQKIFKKDEKIISETTLIEKDNTYNSNIIKDVRYTSRDVKGNEYVITASEGEIDFSNSNIIFLTDVYATIILKNSNLLTISSSYGKYNSNNLDTIFSKNVIINYLDNKITGEYLDFSPRRNSMIVSKNIVYTNLKNILKADVIEIDLKTKDTKIYMYENKKKVKIQSKN